MGFERQELLESSLDGEAKVRRARSLGSLQVEDKREEALATLTDAKEAQGRDDNRATGAALPSEEGVNTRPLTPDQSLATQASYRWFVDLGEWPRLLLQRVRS